MGRRKLMAQVFFAALLPAIAILIAAACYGASYAKRSYLQSVREDLAIRAKLVEPSIAALLAEGNADKVESCCRELEGKTGMRVTVIDSKGAVIADSHEDPAKMGNHRERQEVQEALAGRNGYATRYSSTLDRSMMYMAMPLMRDSNVSHVLRVSLPLNTVEEVLSSVYWHIVFAAAALALLAAALSLIVSRKISRPVKDIKQGAQTISEGNLSFRLPLPDTEELAQLAETLNSMAEQLQQRLDELGKEHGEQSAILSSMAEGLLAVDANSRIIKANQAARELLQLPDDCQGRILHEIVRNTKVQGFVEKLLREGKSQEEELVVLHDGGQRILKARGTILEGQPGAVLLLNEITRLRQLEEMRRDFVANVSHEIKTPLTTIRAAVETLQDGAQHSPEDSARFMKIITKHTDRLSALVEDILSLSNLERDDSRRELSISEHQLDSMLYAAVDLCKEKADARRIAIKVSCVPGFKVSCDRALIEQAVINLIDNAVKYSNEGGSIEISGEGGADRQLRIVVRDSGCGIPKEHLPRLFERFYRVDKARSRKLGGTGLGLAIVKHIVQAHNGSVSVESELGKGSAFAIAMPQR